MRLIQNGHNFAENIFALIFSNENCSYFTEDFPRLSNWQQVSIGSDNVLAPNKR